MQIFSDLIEREGAINLFRSYILANRDFSAMIVAGNDLRSISSQFFVVERSVLAKVRDRNDQICKEQRDGEQTGIFEVI